MMFLWHTVQDVQCQTVWGVEFGTECVMIHVSVWQTGQAVEFEVEGVTNDVSAEHNSGFRVHVFKIVPRWRTD